MTDMVKRCCLILAVFGTLRAQQAIAPTPEPVGIARGGDFANYNIVDSFEIGYRWRLADGSVDTYRSDVNYGDGIRLLATNLSINSKEGHGRWFDEILLSTSGLGNDPYQTASLRVQKNGLYRYDMLWREDDYYNPGLDISGGEHLMDTVRGLQDHSLTLFPQSHFQMDLGYSRNTQNGPALSTVQGFDTLSSAFPVFENVKQQWNEYRIGILADFGGLRFIARHTWDFYKDDSGYSFTGNETSGVATDATVLQQFQRSEPNHGSNPGWFGNVYGSHKYWALNARLTYNIGNGGFALNELTTGLNRFGAADNRQVVVSGDAQRPVVAGDFSFSVFPSSRLSIVVALFDAVGKRVRSPMGLSCWEGQVDRGAPRVRGGGRRDRGAAGPTGLGPVGVARPASVADRAKGGPGHPGPPSGRTEDVRQDHGGGRGQL